MPRKAAPRMMEVTAPSLSLLNPYGLRQQAQSCIISGIMMWLPLAAFLWREWLDDWRGIQGMCWREEGVVATWDCCLWSRRSGLGVFAVRCGATAVRVTKRTQILWAASVSLGQHLVTLSLTKKQNTSMTLSTQLNS